MPETKIVFSHEELHLLNDATLWMNKRTLTSKLYEVLGECAANLKSTHGTAFTNLLHHKTHLNAKISKGENYLGRPYIILDYPDLFSKENIFAMRTMFWFGEMLSCSLIISGAYLDANHDKIISKLARSRHKDLFFCIAPDPWAHHFEKDNMRPLSKMKLSEIKKHVEENGFIKVARKISLTDSGEWNDFIMSSYKMFRSII
jgi:hypothetical protein